MQKTNAPPVFCMIAKDGKLTIEFTCPNLYDDSSGQAWRDSRETSNLYDDSPHQAWRDSRETSNLYDDSSHQAWRDSRVSRAICMFARVGW